MLFICYSHAKEKLSFNNNDEQLSLVCSNLVKMFFKLKEANMITKNIENKNWKMSELVDKSLQAKSIKEYIAIIQSKAPDFYKVQRVNIYLCDHKRQEIYQIVEHDSKSDKLIFFSSQSGIAGKVSNEGKSFIANNVEDYHQFLQKIDDPFGKYHPITGLPEGG